MAGYIVRLLPPKENLTTFLENLKRNHITILIWATSQRCPPGIEKIIETSITNVDPSKLNIYGIVVKKLSGDQTDLFKVMAKTYRVCFVGTNYETAVKHAGELLDTERALENFRLLGPCGFYHSVLQYNNVCWEVLLLADVHQDPKNVPNILKNNRNMGTSRSVTDFVHAKLTSNTCLDLFMEQRKNMHQVCDEKQQPTGYLSITKCFLQKQCQTLYINDTVPKNTVSCVNTDSRVRLHALDFRTVDGIVAYMKRIEESPVAQLPVDLSLLWRSFANAVVLGKIQPERLIWYTCSDSVCLTPRYLSLLEDLYRSYTSSIFSQTSGFESMLGDCLVQFYQSVTSETVERDLSNIILSIDARLFDLSYVFEMFRADTYSTNTVQCDSRHRNVLLYAGYQHIQFVQLLIQCVFKQNIITEDGNVKKDPAFVLSESSIKSGLGSGFVVTMMNEPFKQPRYITRTASV